MYREETTQYSSYLNRDMHMLIHGHAGVPFLSFPTQDSMCRNYEEFGMVDHLADIIDEGRIQLFVVDTVDAESWSQVFGDSEHRAWIQEQYFQYIIEEALPQIRSRNPETPRGHRLQHGRQSRSHHLPAAAGSVPGDDRPVRHL